MKNFLCWNPNAVREVINPFAEHMADGLFRAVHTDWDLMVSPPVGKSFQMVTEAAFTPMTPAEFLADFMRADRPHAFAAVLGETGSGKSHLVHWMRLHLKSTEKQLVLTVRKSGTSLRAIVKMIIDELPADERQGFLDTLNASGEGTATPSGQKQQLLNDLAQSIRDEPASPDAGEVEAELSRALPDLFQDPYMRDAHFFSDESVIAEIVAHIFAPSNARDRPDKRRSFQIDDLPVGGADYIHASKQAQAAIKIIDLDPAAYRALAVDIINRNLDRAVARTLSFTGDRVEELMTRLRAHLKSKGMELILLIEEFARLQGIDRALLQTMTSHGDDRLCKMRSAVAVTTGFFESVAETAYMRTTHIVDMDRSAGRAGAAMVTEASLSAFTVRYLNAVRLGTAAINDWGRDAAPTDQVRSACDGCRHRIVCHAAFGEVDGYGLYPFTPTALRLGAGMVDDAMPQSFNPRILQNDLLVEVLDNQAPTIALGQYPAAQLLSKLGGDRHKRLQLSEQARLRNASPVHADRWITFLELYDGTGRIANPPAPIREAFDLPEIPDADIAKAPPEPAPDADFKTVEPQSTAKISREDQAIESWISGGGLDQNVATTLRNLVYAAVADSIDWDLIGLTRAYHLGKSRAFQPIAVVFERQTTQSPSYLPIRLLIPGGHIDDATTGLALQGMIKASKSGFNWDFPGGERMLAAFLDCLEAWTRDVEAQLVALRQPAPNWRPALAALELLSITSAINGKLKTDATAADMADAAFMTPSQECASTAPAMIGLYDKLRTQREKLMAVARSALSSTKGGQAGAMLDASKYVDVIRALRRTKWRLTQTPPTNDVTDVAKLYREAQAVLPDAAAAEWKIRTEWLARVIDNFGPEPKRSVIVSGLRAARQAAIDVGLNTQNASKPLGDALDLFEGVQFDDTVTAFRTLSRLEDPLAALPHFGRGRRNAINHTDSLITIATQFLDNVDVATDMFGGEQKAKHDAIAASLDQIDADLALISQSLSEITASEGATDAA